MINILMPIYNGIEFIDESVTSIKKQTFKEWELIIGINGHPPNSEVYKKAKKYENDKIKVIDLFEIKGKSGALNRMLNHCQYDWISLLDVDDIWKPTKLESQLKFMKEYDVIGTKCQYFGDLMAIPNIPVGNISNFDFLKVNPIINSSCLVKKELCWWNKEWWGIEDYDMWLRLRKQKKRFYNVETIEVEHRIHKQSAFNAKGNNNSVESLLKAHR
jgi:glycosyltransferase involved in cell wall biosynthesis